MEEVELLLGGTTSSLHPFPSRPKRSMNYYIQYFTSKNEVIIYVQYLHILSAHEENEVGFKVSRHHFHAFFGSFYPSSILPDKRRKLPHNLLFFLSASRLSLFPVISQVRSTNTSIFYPSHLLSFHTSTLGRFRGQSLVPLHIVGVFLASGTGSGISRNCTQQKTGYLHALQMSETNPGLTSIFSSHPMKKVTPSAQ